MKKIVAVLVSFVVLFSMGCSVGQKPGLTQLDNTMPRAPEFTAAGLAGCFAGHEGKAGKGVGLGTAGACIALLSPIVGVFLVTAAAGEMSKAAKGTGAQFVATQSDFDKEVVCSLDFRLKELMGDRYVDVGSLRNPDAADPQKQGEDLTRDIVEKNGLDFAIVPRIYYTTHGGGLHPYPAMVVDWSVVDKNLAEKWKIKTTVFFDKDGPKINNTSDPDNAKFYAELAAKSAEDFWLMWNGGAPVHSKQITR